MEITKSISIIIPNYNGRKLLHEYLPYTFGVINATGAIYEIIIVDDCSTDGSAEFIRTEYPEVNLIVNPQSKGLPWSYNKGIEIAQYELILFLNADVKLTPGYFDLQWRYFLRWDTFGVMGRIIDMDADHIQEAARAPKFTGYKIKTDYFYYTGNENDRLYTFYLSYANAMISAEKLKQIGGFYELFTPSCFGDADLSIRAWRLKWKCYYEHDSICRRPPSATIKNYEYYRNLYCLHAVHLDGFKLIAWRIQIILFDLLPNILIGRIWIWKSYGQLFAKRAVIKAYRQKLNDSMFKTDSRITVANVVHKIHNFAKIKYPIRIKP